MRLVELQAAHSKIGQQAVHCARLAHAAAIELKASPISVTFGRLAPDLRSYRCKPCFGQFQRLGVPVEADETAFRAELPNDALGMAPKPSVQST